MRVSLQWLKELLICPSEEGAAEALNAEALAERLSVAGLVVEAF
jgi:hypothetical protein